MYCPRCGTPNESGDRFCSSCGATLSGTSEEKTEQRSPREQIGRLLGTTRKARVISAATAILLVVAVAAFVALKPASEDKVPRDAYTIAADGFCVAAKQKIVAAERRSLSGTGANNSSLGFAQSLLPIVATWRSQFQALKVPANRVEQAQQLDTALREIEIQIGELARVAAEGDRSRTLASAKRADAASSEVEAAVASLGLTRCAALTIGFSLHQS